MSDIEIRCDVPPTLHPDSLANEAKILDHSGTVGASSIGHARSALRTMYSTYSVIEDAEKALMQAVHKQPVNFAKGMVPSNLRKHGSELRYSHGRENELAKAATVAYERACKEINSRRASLEKQKDVLIERTCHEITPDKFDRPLMAAISQEIRSHCKSLPGAERLQFANEAIEAGDRGTVAALIGVPSFLSGLTDANQQNIRARASAVFAPVDFEQSKSVARVIAHLDAAAEKLTARWAKSQQAVNQPLAKAMGKLKTLNDPHSTTS